jgi:hypothetical protein
MHYHGYAVYFPAGTGAFQQTESDPTGAQHEI